MHPEREFKNYREQSKLNWGSTNETLTLEQVNAGALLRIADATELMAKNYVQLQYDLDYYKTRSERLQKELNSANRSNSALRGHLKRKKNK